MADDQNDAASSSPEDARGLRKLLEEAKAEAAAAKQQLAEATKRAERDAAFAKAGLPDSKLADLFRDSYQGDLTPDAIKAQAIEIGLVQAQTTTPPAERQQLLAAQQDPFLPNRADIPDGTYQGVIDAINAPGVKGDSDAIQAILIQHGLY